MHRLTAMMTAFALASVLAVFAVVPNGFGWG